MKIYSNKIQLALNISLFIAYNSSQEKPLSKKLISKYYGYESRKLEPILCTLAKNNIMTSILGNSGGYFIKNLRQVSVKDIITCFDDERKEKTIPFEEYTKDLNRLMAQHRTSYLKGLDDISLFSIYEKLKLSKLPKIKVDNLDFTI